MNTLALPQIIEFIASKSSIRPEQCRKLAEALIDVISDGLVRGETVHVPHVGVFKAVSKLGEITVAYAPENELAARVNAPFAMFETVILPENFSEDDLELREDGNVNIEEQQPVETGHISDEIQDIVKTDDTPAQEAVHETPSVVLPPPIPSFVIRPDMICQTQADSTASLCTENRQPHVDDKTEEQKNPANLDSCNRNEQPTVGTSGSEQEESMDDGCNQSNLNDPSVNKIIERERVVEVRPWTSHITMIVVLTAVLALIVGCVAGYTISSRVNFGPVKNVNIEAEGVKVYNADAGTSAGLMAADSITSRTEDLAEADSIISNTGKAIVSPAAVTDTVRGTRYLTTMAKAHYGSKLFWVYIYQENKSTIPDPDNIPNNTVVVIPPAEKYGIKAGDKGSEDAARKLAADIYNQ